ncbi:GAF domain-containing protein [Pedobacter psychroterrae]|uniref:histidine kinase n=1 Tax=Pedobacter psychroterrae TaxID=2530453 RepID=A0A4R0NRP8_9SPHI|nr:GAF domain-containing protein [Pedobacter psychroterrae]TCD01754.1 PAS domain S-box protein [Pedobacter psychroterrae]
MTLSGVKSVLRMSPKATIILIPDYPRFTIADVNVAFLEIFNRKPTELIENGFFEVFGRNLEDGDTKSISELFDHVLTLKTAGGARVNRSKFGLIDQDSAYTYYTDIEVFPVLDENNEVAYIIQMLTDIMLPVLPLEFTVDINSRRTTELERLEKTVFELNSKREYAIQDVLSCYVNGIEALFPHAICSILQIKNERLYNLSSPTLQDFYVNALEGLEIGDDVGSCGTSAYLKQIIIVEDIDKDRRWVKYKELASKAGFKACWSHPIIDSEGGVMATFAIYYRQPKRPDTEELKIIERAVSLLKVILENKKNLEILKETTLLMTQGQELAHFGNWSWDIKNNIVHWSDSLFAIYGLDKSSFKATFEGYLELLHHEEKERVQKIIQNVLSTRNDVEFEERIVRPNGEIRYLKSWGKLKIDDRGIPEKMIGACLDITESKKIQEELLASETRLRSVEWAQSHLVRGPLTRIMGITELLFDKDTNDTSRSQLLIYLDSSARELDKVIKDIVNKSY